MSGFLRHPLVRPVVAFLRWLLIIVLWTATVAAVLLAFASLARIFTGDEQFGALDGFQFTNALYRAIFRFILAAVAALALRAVLRWRPGRSTRGDQPGAADKIAGADEVEGADKPGDVGADGKADQPEKPFKGRPRAWVIPEDE